MSKLDDIVSGWHHDIPGFWDAREAKDDVKAADLLGTWIADNTYLSDAPYLLKHDSRPGIDVYLEAIEHKGGLWCGGLATVISWALNAIGQPSCCYNYGYHDQNVSHVIVLSVDRRTDQIYPHDFYLGTVWLLDKPRRRATFAEVLTCAALGRYEEIVVAERIISREIQRATGIEREVVNLDRFFGPKTAKWPVIQNLAAGRSMDEFWLDLLLVKPEFGKMLAPEEAFHQVRGYTNLATTLIGALHEAQ